MLVKQTLSCEDFVINQFMMLVRYHRVSYGGIVIGGVVYLSRGHRGPLGKWSGMPGLGVLVRNN